MKKAVSVLLIGAILVSLLSMVGFAAGESVSVTITGGKTGNIFFDYEIPEFDVCFNNTNNSSVNVSAQYFVRVVDGKGDISEENVISGSKDFSIAANSSYEDTIICNVENYAIYKLYVLVDGIEYSTLFSLCPRVESQNYTLGVHQPNAGSEQNASNGFDPDVLLKLMHDSGMGLIRDGIRWRNCKWGAQSTFKIYDKASKLLEAVDKYDMEFLCVLSSVSAAYAKQNINPNTIWGLVGDSALDKYATEYIKGIIEAPEAIGRIAAVEIANEPEWVTMDSDGNSFAGSLSGQTSNGRDSYLGGVAYGKMLKTAYNTIKNSTNPVTVVGMSSISNGSSAYSKFLNGVKSSVGGNTTMDVASFHPYTPWVSGYTPLNYTRQYADTMFGSQKDKFTDSLDSANIGRANPDSVWNTEIGYTTGINGGDNCYVLNEEEQAKRILRSYNAIKMDDFDSKTYIHNFVSSGVDLDDREGNFGILKSRESETPFAARYAFLAIANINRMLDGAVGVEDMSNTNAVISKYTGKKTVWMMYAKRYNAEADYSLPDGTYCFYDMYGNKIDRPQKLTTAPVFAVSEEIEKVLPEEYRMNLVQGTLGADNANAKISLSVTDGTRFTGYNGRDMVANTLYLDQSLTDAKGKFLFAFPLSSDSNDLVAHVSKNGSAYANISVVKPEKMPINLNLLTGISKVNSLSIDSLDLNNIKVFVDFGYNKLDKCPAVICAAYDGKSLVGISVGKMSDVTTGDVEVDFANTVSGYNMIKLMLWEDDDKMVPLCDVKIIK